MATPEEQPAAYQAAAASSSGAGKPASLCTQTSQQADRAMRAQALIRQLLTGELRGKKRIDSVRLLRRLMNQLDYQLNWSTQLDFFEALERLLRDERQNIEESDWRLAYDVTQLLTDSIGRLQFRLERRSLGRLFGCVVENLGHRRSEVRRASLLLISACLQDGANDFQLLLQLFIEQGLANQRDQEAQRGAILSLPLLMNEQVCRGEDLLPLVRCLANLLIDSTHTQLFYSLYLALQRLSQTLGERQFNDYLRQCDPEAMHLYRQTMSRSGSLATSQLATACRSGSPHPASSSCDTPTVAPAAQQRQLPVEREPPLASADTGPRQVTFEDETGGFLSSSPASSESSAASSEGGGSESQFNTRTNITNNNNNNQQQQQQQQEVRNRGASQTEEDSVRAEAEVRRAHAHAKTTSVSSACSSEAPLVDPASYMASNALNGHPLEDFQRLHHEMHPTVATASDEPEEWLAINDLCVSCTPTTELQPHRELKFGIFPRHLVQAALNTRTQTRYRLEALEEMMRIVRESPVNHLAILMTYFDSFLDQLLARLLTGTTATDNHDQHQPAASVGGDQNLELIALDMIESVVIKTKVSTMQFVRPLVGLLVQALARTRWRQVRDNIGRVLHKMMAYLPPQHVIDALFEHKHSRSGYVREEAINRVTGAVLEFGRQEFNLTKLCYHVLPMLADQQAQVRLAALECIAALARALGPERIGSLLTAAEAVQTGCELEGLLGAIYTRLQRRALPKCMPDGSIQPVLKMANISVYRGPISGLAADLRWVLETPARHQQQAKLQTRGGGGGAAAAAPVIDLKPPGLPTPVGHYSPIDSNTATQERRHSIAFNLHPLPAEPASSGPPPEAEVDEHENSAADQPAPTLIDTKRTQPDSASNSPPTPDHASHEPVDAVSKCKTNNNSKPQLQKDNQKPKLQAIRYSSQESVSSSDTNKVLFQYYLGKFRQSLTEADYSLGTQHPALPSDSLIYTTDTQQAYELARHRTRQQQTSFDYEPNSVGRIPPASNSVAPVNGSGKQQATSSPARGKQEKAVNSQPVDEAPDLQASSNSQACRLEEVSGLQVSSAGQINESGADGAIDAANGNSSSQVAAKERSSTADDASPVESQENQKRRSKAPGLVRQAASQDPTAAPVVESTPETEKVAQPQEQVSNTTQRESRKSRRSSQQSDQMSKRLDSQATCALSSSGSSRELSDQATQTTPVPEAAQESNESRHSKRNRRASSQVRSRRRSQRGHKSAAGDDEVELMNDDEPAAMRDYDAELARLEVRQRESRSQPPQPRLNNYQQQQQHPSQSRIIHVDRSQRDHCSGLGDRRSVSVSPSLAASANIKHLLETVAQVEGPFQEPQLAYRVASEALQSPCWSTKVEGILALVRLTSHHPALLLQEAHLYETVGRLTLETRNLRSTVARAAIFTLGDLCAKLGRALEPQADIIVRSLMQRSSDNTDFIREDIRRALLSMVESLTNWRLANLLMMHGAGHKNALVRRMAAYFLAQLVERMGPARCLVGSRDISAQLLPAAANLAQDSSPQARYFGRLMLARLMQHSAFDRLLRKNLAPNLYRSTFGVVESVRRRGAGDPPLEPI